MPDVPPIGPRIRRAGPDDAEPIAGVHVAAWQAGYAGLLPAAYLAGLSIEQRTASWAEHLRADAPGRTLVALDEVRYRIDADVIRSERDSHQAL